MGALAVPFKLLKKVPRYVPPRSQIVSPGLTAAGWANAAARLQGLPIVPLPLAIPEGET